MAATSGKQFAVGMRYINVYALNADGFPAATSTTVYDGVKAEGAKAFELSIPDVRRIAHTGDDRILAQDILPRTEVSSGSITVGRHDYDVHEVLTGTKSATIGEAKIIGYGTSKQGSEPDVAILMYQQSLDATSKTRRYRSYILPATRAIVTPASLNENAPTFTYSLIPQIAEQYPWGISFTDAVEGYTSAEITEAMTEGEPHICAWKADGTATEFLFSTDMQATATGKIHVVTDNGTDVTSSITKAESKITFSVPPTADHIIVCFYEV